MTAEDIAGAGHKLKASRRSIVTGIAWTIPTVIVAAPAAHAGPSQCETGDSIRVGPNVSGQNIRAVCSADSQLPFNPRVIRAQYGLANMPQFLEICNCQQTPAWYRWRETDSRGNFQIEVDGEHNDQNSNTQGFRRGFWLESFGGAGGCRRFALTYRTSTDLPTSNATVSIDWVLQRNPAPFSATPPTSGWTTIQTLTTNGQVVRRAGQNNPNFNSCAANQRMAAVPEGTSGASGPSEGAATSAPVPQGD